MKRQAKNWKKIIQCIKPNKGAFDAYFNVLNPTKDYYPEYIKESYKSIREKTTTQQESSHRI